jgi:threonine dehydrogenase-like Zn-dependent dehydrogenase
MTTKMMKAARIHRTGAPFQVDEIAIPQPTGSDVLIEVKACGVVPNLRNVINHFEEWFPYLPLPAHPAIYGLDPAGTVAALGPDAAGLAIGQRVYVNPVRTCRVCVHCRRCHWTRCPAYTFAGYFGFGPQSREIQARYPWGGFAEYMIAPVNSLVTLPDNLSFENASRFGYLGTSYAALRRGLTSTTTTVLIDGATGTLGVGLVLCALALGVPRILAVARNRELLAKMRALNPQRIETFSTLDGSTTEWAKGLTDGFGVDLVVEALGPEAPLSASLEAIYSIGRGGNIVTIGGQKEPVPINPIWLMAQDLNYMGSNWFTTSQAQDMAELIRSGVLDLSSFTSRTFGLDAIDAALDAAGHRATGGFTNIVVTP